MSTSADRSPEAWTPCDNELSALGGRMRARHARKVQARVISGVAGAAAVVAWLAFLPWADTGLISCQECVRRMPAYHQDLVGAGDLPTDQADAVRQHLDSCPKCRNYFEQEFPLDKPDAAAIGLAAWPPGSPRG